MVGQDSGSPAPVQNLSPLENRRFGRWLAPVAILAAVVICLWLFSHRRGQQPLALPYHPPNPALLTKYGNVPVGWAGPPQWFLGSEGRAWRYEVYLDQGLFVHNQTDLYVGDAIPLVLGRTYFSRYKQSQAFGMGTVSSLDMYLQGDNQPFTYIEIILPDGGQLYYRRVSPGVGFSDAVYLHRPGPGEAANIYWGSTLRWDVNRWDLKLADGTILNFPPSRYATRAGQAALIRVTRPTGDTLTIERDSMGNVLKVTSPNGATMTLTHDAANRITSARDSQGHFVTYVYDAKGYLVEVKSAEGITSYAYDKNGMMSAITKPDATVWADSTYNDHGLLMSVHNYGKTTRYSYTTDQKGTITGTEVTSPYGAVDDYTFDSNGITTGHMQKKAPQRSEGSPAQEKTL
jgi:YD repeat-containing protein